MKVKYIIYRVEFLVRGAAHLHGTLWLDIKKIEKDLIVEKWKEAFIKLWNDIALSEIEKSAVGTF